MEKILDDVTMQEAIEAFYRGETLHWFSNDRKRAIRFSPDDLGNPLGRISFHDLIYGDWTVERGVLH